MNRWRRAPAQVPPTSPESEALSKDLHRRGFSFVGPTVCYAHLQAAGLINNHLVGCFRYANSQAPGHRARCRRDPDRILRPKPWRKNRPPGPLDEALRTIEGAVPGRITVRGGVELVGPALAHSMAARSRARPMPRPAWSGCTESCSRWAPASMASIRQSPTGWSPATSTTRAGRTPRRGRAGERPRPNGSNIVSAAASVPGVKVSSSEADRADDGWRRGPGEQREATVDVPAGARLRARPKGVDQEATDTAELRLLRRCLASQEPRSWRSGA